MVIISYHVKYNTRYIRKKYRNYFLLQSIGQKITHQGTSLSGTNPEKINSSLHPRPTSRLTKTLGATAKAKQTEKLRSHTAVKHNTRKPDKIIPREQQRPAILHRVGLRAFSRNYSTFVSSLCLFWPFFLTAFIEWPAGTAGILACKGSGDCRTLFFLFSFFHSLSIKEPWSQRQLDVDALSCSPLAM